jgi:Amino acid permease
VQTIVGVPVLLPLLIIGIVPLITGDVAMQAFQPFAPGTDPATAAWNYAGWTLFFGGLFIAAWSAYAFETAICSTRANSVIRVLIPTKPSFTQDCCASRSTFSCRFPFRARLASQA